MKKIFFFASLKSRKEKDPALDPESDTDPLVRGTDLRIRIRTKMSQVPNTGANLVFKVRHLSATFGKKFRYL
jgi:hypothetical protein